MPVRVALLLLALEVVVLAGGLLWTFRRAQLPVGVLGALGLAVVVGTSQVLLAVVVQLGLDLGAGRAPFAADNPWLPGPVLHWPSVSLAALAIGVAAPLALQRFLKLNGRWTRALSRELLTGFIASMFGALVIGGALLIAGLIVAGLLHRH
ncbi:MAG: hypothetical protein HYS27_14680 [Deltaproteobacteria bacterium]|nr:hypothetical protein [Deltaproteobacteria bacterium]